MLSVDSLVDVATSLGIDTEDLIAVERVERIHHSFRVASSRFSTMTYSDLRALFDQFGHAATIEFRLGELIELSVDASTPEATVMDFVDRAATDYDVVVMVDKRRLVEQLGLTRRDREVVLFLFTDTLNRLIERGLTVFEGEVWRDPSEAWLSTSWIPTPRSQEPGCPLSPLSSSFDESDHLASDSSWVREIRDSRDRLIGWDEQWTRSLTPLHFHVRGRSDNQRLADLLHAQLVKLAILYTCDRARTRSRPGAHPEIRAEFRGQAHVAIVPVDEGEPLGVADQLTLNSVAGLVEWVYARDSKGHVPRLS